MVTLDIVKLAAPVMVKLLNGVIEPSVVGTAPVETNAAVPDPALITRLCAPFNSEEIVTPFPVNMTGAPKTIPAVCVNAVTAGASKVKLPAAVRLAFKLSGPTSPAELELISKLPTVVVTGTFTLIEF